MSLRPERRRRLRVQQGIETAWWSRGSRDRAFRRAAAHRGRRGVHHRRRSVVAAAFVVSVNEPVKPPILQTIGPKLDRLRQAVMAATGARREDPQETGREDGRPAAEAAASNTPVDFPPIDFPPSGPQPTRGTAGHLGHPIGTSPGNSDANAAGSDGANPASSNAAATRANDAPAANNAVPAPTPGADASRPGDMIEALDVSNHPVFSPLFAVDDSAIFFDQDNAGGGSALKEARTEGTGGVLHVLSVLDDGARNYHPRLSPDGSQVAFDSDRDGVRGIYLSDRSGHNIRRVSGEGYAAVPAWSPDGTRLAYIKAEPQNSRVWNIWTLDVGVGVATRLTLYRVGQPWGASWFPDNQRICYSHEDRLIVLTRRPTSRDLPLAAEGRPRADASRLPRRRAGDLPAVSRRRLAARSLRRHHEQSAR